MLNFLKLNQSPTEDIVSCVGEDDQIPKIVHQTFSTEELPPRIRANVAFIKAQNPDFKWRFYDDKKIEEFIGAHYGKHVLNLFLKINPGYGAARADLFKYLCVYKLGGVYLDIKSTTTKPLSSVLRSDDRFIISQWSNVVAGGRFANWGKYKALIGVPGGEFQQWFIISVAGHPFLKAVINQVLFNIERYNPFLHGSGRGAVIHTTGPVAYTLAIAGIRDRYPHRHVDIEQDFGLKYSIFLDEGELSHHDLFKNHYGRRMDSLIQIGEPWESVYFQLNRSHWKIRSGLRNYGPMQVLKRLLLAKK